MASKTQDAGLGLEGVVVSRLQLAYSKKQETQQSTDKGSEEDQSLQALQMFHSWMRTSVFWWEIVNLNLFPNPGKLHSTP